MAFSENYSVYFIEFHEVADFEAFYSANAHHEPSINQTAGVKENTYLTYAVKVLGDDRENHKYYKLFENYASVR